MYSLYGDDFQKTLNPEFNTKLLMEGITKEDVSGKHSLAHQALTAYETLRDLGVIKDDKSKNKPQQLNS